MKTFGAIFQCYKNKKATDFVLNNFRKFFPDNKILLISDGGDDFSDLADTYKCKYEHRKNIYGNPSVGYAYDSTRLIEWWDRQKSACDYCGTDYILLLEDDVLVTNFFEIDLNFHLIGPNSGEPLTKTIIDEIKNCSNLDVTRYGICGGSMYNTKTFNEIYNQVIRDIEENHDALMNSSHGGYKLLGYVDANMVYHFGKRGYAFQGSPWLSEIMRGESRNKPIWHQFKDYY